MLEFNEETHKYMIDGVEVPSVTQLVAPLGDDMDEPDDYMELAIDQAAERGTTLHAYIEHRLHGGDPEEFELPDAYARYAVGVEQFLSEHEVSPLLVEEHLAGYGFAGTPDLVCTMDGDDVAILDWKFVSTLAKTKVGAQLAGYKEICELHGIFPDRLAAVQFTKDGSYKIYPVDPEAGREAFHTCLRIHSLKTKKHPRGRIG